MTDFKIDKDVPIISSDTVKLRWPFGEMEVGDSFLIPEDIKPRVISAASYYGLRHKKKFSIRKTTDGYRCWRIA